MVRILVLVLIAIAAAISALFLLPGLKEGFDSSDLAFLSAVAGALALTTWLWSRFTRGASRAAGLLILALPLASYTFLSARLVYNEWLGGRLAAQTRIVKFQATPIEWPGFDSPVGLRLEIELERPQGLAGNLFPPKLALSFTSLDRRAYYDYGPAWLAEPNFPLPHRPYTFPPRVTYDLYSSAIDRLDSPSLLCLGRGEASLTMEGDRVAATWFFAAASGASIDLSPHLTAALRQSSLTPAAFAALLRGVQPDSLRAAGYSGCRPPQASQSQSCFCR